MSNGKYSSVSSGYKKHFSKGPKNPASAQRYHQAGLQLHRVLEEQGIPEYRVDRILLVEEIVSERLSDQGIVSALKTEVYYV